MWRSFPVCLWLYAVWIVPTLMELLPPVQRKLGQYILDNVIVEPKGLTADSFDTMEEYNAVTTWGRDVMYGKFRKESNANGAKAKG